MQLSNPSKSGDVLAGSFMLLGTARFSMHYHQSFTDCHFQIVPFSAGVHPPSTIHADIRFAFMGDIIQV
jgi:hypothetical protein